MKEIFEEFRNLSRLEINEGKTKVIRIGANLDNLTPKTAEVIFKYVTSFTLLGVNIDTLKSGKKESDKRLQYGEN
jgi:hypothetical protein